MLLISVLCGDFSDWVSCLALDRFGKNADYADAAFARLSAVLMA